ncbi:uncharacterized protein LOC106673136 [Cimex lectularius]|uniref:WD repeat-containing protein 55 homolog n=1 Tax=Cimex lectularius TaxID=79782 RepID=A0A8I6THH8_CIMLE|nr:uncharacterized protein LOC106673136 [Cimex lectularius]
MNHEVLKKAKEDEKNLRPFIAFEQLQRINTDICYVQDWYSKASWINKLKFCTRLFEVLKDGVHVIDLVYFIGSPEKDLTYSKEQNAKCSYDIQPLDHNRSLSDEHLVKMRRYYVNWFKSLPDYQQIPVFISLLHMGGSLLQESIYQMGVNVLKQKEELIAMELENDKKLEEARKKLVKIENRLNAKFRRKKRKFTKKDRKKLTVQNSASAPPVETKHPSKTSIDTQIITSEGLMKGGRLIDIFLGPRQNAKAKLELTRLQQQWAKISTDIETTSVKAQSTLYPDRVQMLPIWVNRKIIHQLPESSYQTLSRVNSYWREMITQVRKEKRARKTIDFAALSIESSAPVYRINFQVLCKEDKNGKRVHKLKKIHSQTNQHSKKLVKARVMTTTGAFSTIVPEDEIKRAKFSDYYLTIEKESKFSVDKCTLSVISTDYGLNRSGVASQRWIVIADQNGLKFHCTKTGAPSTIAIHDCHIDPITCLALHPNNYQIFTASFDGKIKLFDIWSKQCKLTYSGHKNIIISIEANSSYLVSCSADLQLKIFRIDSAACILTLELQEGLPTKLCVDEENSVYIGNVNGKVVMVRFNDHGTALLEKDLMYGVIVHAHCGEITCLSTYPLFVISGGIDGYVRIWDADLNDPHSIGSYKHKTRVNSAVVSFLKLFTACEDGELYIWNVEKCIVLKQMTINTNGRPIVNMYCLEEHFFIKLVLFNELDIKLLEIDLPWKSCEDFKRPKFSAAKSIEHTKRLRDMDPKMTREDIQMLKLHYRNTILENLRGTSTKERTEDQKPTIYSTAVDEINEVKSFPRYYKTEKSQTTSNFKYYKPSISVESKFSQQ